MKNFTDDFFPQKIKHVCFINFKYVFMQYFKPVQLSFVNQITSITQVQENLKALLKKLEISWK